MTVLTGIEVLKAQDFAALGGRRVGLMTNLSAVDLCLRTTYDIFTSSTQVNLAALFAPEHGFFSAVPDGEQIDSCTDPYTGVPIYSLYGQSYRPTEAMLANVEVVVCDIQDVGARYYTYLWTISHILEAAGTAGVDVVILDRPNPLGGQKIYGASLEPHLASLVGRFPIPICHGMTIGELAQMINMLWNATPAELSIVPCSGWTRTQYWNETGLIWVSPSPNIPHFSTVLQYPGACLIEGTNLSEGRGTTLPFEIVGAPWINGAELATYLNGQNFPGVRFRPHSFKPSLSKWAGEICQGIQVHVIDVHSFRPLDVWLAVITSISARYPDFQWIPAHRARFHFDRLIGTEQVRQAVNEQVSLDGLKAEWENFCVGFAQQRNPFLLYD